MAVGMTDDQPTVQAIRFTGEIAGDVLRSSVEFDVVVDARGTLQLTFQPVPTTAEALGAFDRSTRDGRFTKSRLVGEAAGGQRFSSETFYITGVNHGSDPDRGVTFRGRCSVAIIEEIFPETSSPRLIWWVRCLDTFRPLTCRMDPGTAIASGRKSEGDPQRLTGCFAIEAQPGHEDSWWAEAGLVLEHLSRCMSLACGTYFRPHLVERRQGPRRTLEMRAHSPTAEPSLEACPSLDLDPIFQCACAGYAERFDRMKRLDVALQWLLAPGYYDEIRLLNAMTALENVLHGSDGTQADFLAPRPFKTLKSSVREFLLGERVPDGMLEKIPELNRRTFAHKLTDLLAQRGTATEGLPAASLRAMIKARNDVVHRGLYRTGDPNQTDAWTHMLLARELVIRLALDELGYGGRYLDAMNGYALVDFPKGNRPAVPTDQPEP